MPARDSTSWFAQLGGPAKAVWRKLVRAATSGDGNPAAAVPLRGEARRYLDPDVLARVGFSPLLARVVVEGFLSGLHKSPFHGFSVEFADHREYVPGDDLKYLDWPLFARTDQYYIKRFEEETNLRCHIVLDASASMGYGTGQYTKWDYSCFLASCLAYLMLRQQDAAGLSLVSVKPGLLIPPRAKRLHLRTLMRGLVQQEPNGRTDLPSSLRAVLRNLKRRGLVVIISDLLDDPAPTLKAIRLFASHRHEVVVFHVLDGMERDFAFEGATQFVDLESNEELEIDPSASRAQYLSRLAEAEAIFSKGLADAGIDYLCIDTRQPYDEALSAYLARRARVRR
jgi:uncharacterized protein (DUF58 family)